MTSRGAFHRDGGYTLLEMLAYTVVLAVIVNVSSAMFLSGKRLHALGDIALERIEIFRQLERQFHETVVDADRVEAALPGVSVSGPRLVLREGNGEAGHRFILWHRDAAGALRCERYERAGETLALRSSRAYDLPITNLRFAVDEADGGATLVRMDLEIDNAGTRNTVPATNVFVAAVRGMSTTR